MRMCIDLKYCLSHNIYGHVQLANFTVFKQWSTGSCAAKFIHLPTLHCIYIITSHEDLLRMLTM